MKNKRNKTSRQRGLTEQEDVAACGSGRAKTTLSKESVLELKLIISCN